MEIESKYQPDDFLGREIGGFRVAFGDEVAYTTYTWNP